MSNFQTKKLVFVSSDNNNKFYNMIQINSNEWEAEWGRIGVTKTKKVYSMNQWDKKYKEKIKKGYKDQTGLFVVESSKKDFAKISNSSISKIVYDLQAFANKSVASNYTVTTDEVTEKQINVAQDIIDELMALIKIRRRTSSFNDNLLELWMTVPRKISNTREEILQFKSFSTKEQIAIAEKIVAQEQSVLDVMRGQVKVATVQGQQNDEDLNLTILDAMGLSINPSSKKEIDLIKFKLGQIKGKFVNAWNVENKNTRKNYIKNINDSDNKKEELFWHGSRNENWWSIIDSGLVLRPANAVTTGSMVGYGLYMADKAKKSYGYTSARGSYWARGNSLRCFLALYDVHVGNQLIVNKHQNWMYSLTWSNLRKRGDYDSVFFKGGVDLYNNEYVIYKENQCTIKHLVELSG